MIYFNSRELRKADMDEVQRWILSLLKPEERPTTRALKKYQVSVPRSKLYTDQEQEIEVQMKEESNAETQALPLIPDLLTFDEPSEVFLQRLGIYDTTVMTFTASEIESYMDANENNLIEGKRFIVVPEVPEAIIVPGSVKVKRIGNVMIKSVIVRVAPLHHSIIKSTTTYLLKVRSKMDRNNWMIHMISQFMRMNSMGEKHEGREVEIVGNKDGGFVPVERELNIKGEYDI
ncbi:hypothetical protein H5410_021707 [Solanum commersonii]|uniref:Uncharacterized protein n=1 Tax=Solanum commersonii TaxID=4109 RepID=A0A9J5ZCP8_SOLCO|nr:hypothetical protein H5410_021707 [Solanum commersonii]